MNPQSQIAAAAAAAFFPDPPIDNAARQKLIALAAQKFGGAFVDEAFRLVERTGYIREVSARGTFKDLAGEKRLKSFAETVGGFKSNFNFWLQGMDNDVLDEFPAQKLICVIPEAPDVAEMPARWRAAGGNLFGGEMVALKWDQVWFNISAFNLPFAPFQLNSGYDVEDVDRAEAESLGFKIPRTFTATVKINLDTEDLRRRFSKAIQQLESL